MIGCTSSKTSTVGTRADADQVALGDDEAVASANRTRGPIPRRGHVTTDGRAHEPRSSAAACFCRRVGGIVPRPSSAAWPVSDRNTSSRRRLVQGDVLDVHDLRAVEPPDGLEHHRRAVLADLDAHQAGRRGRRRGRRGRAPSGCFRPRPSRLGSRRAVRAPRHRSVASGRSRCPGRSRARRRSRRSGR